MVVRLCHNGIKNIGRETMPQQREVADGSASNSYKIATGSAPQNNIFPGSLVFSGKEGVSDTSMSLSRRGLSPMSAFNLRNSTAVLFFTCCIVGVVTFLSPVAGQPPVPEKKDGNAKVATGRQSESDKDRIQGNWQLMSLDLGFKVVKREDKSEEWKDAFGKEMFFKGDRHGSTVEHSSRQVQAG